MENQDVSGVFLLRLWPWLEANKVRLIGLAVVALVIAAVFYVISSLHQQKEIAAGEAVTQMMFTQASPNNEQQTADAYEQLAAKYAGTVAAGRAQLQAAATLFDAGHFAEAQTQFQKYLDDNPGGALAATAQLGVGVSLEAQNKLDLAGTAYQKVLSLYAGSSSALSAEFALGRIAESQGKLVEAESHYENVARAGQVAGSLGREASGRAMQLKAKLPATSATSVIPAASPTTVSNSNSIPTLKLK